MIFSSLYFRFSLPFPIHLLISLFIYLSNKYSLNIEDNVLFWLVYEKKQKKISKVHDFEEKADKEANNYKTVKNMPLCKYVQRLLGQELISQSKKTVRGK